jgi:hypothetical protein
MIQMMRQQADRLVSSENAYSSAAQLLHEMSDNHRRFMSRSRSPIDGVDMNVDSRAAGEAGSFDELGPGESRPKLQYSAF